MKRLAAFAVTAAAALSLAGGASPGNSDGFKTAKPPYLIPMVPGAAVDPILSTGDVVGGYQMSGIPDGLGAFKDGGDTLHVFMNHEMRASTPGGNAGNVRPIS